MKFSKKAVMVIASLISVGASAGDIFQFDATACAKIAQKFGSNPFSLNVGELDQLQLCADGLKAMVVQQKTNDEVNRAIERNFAPARHDAE